MITFDEFYIEYHKHDGERTQRKQLAFDGYEVHFPNGDVYRHIETLIEGRTPFLGNYSANDFLSVNTWNGRKIQME